MNIYKNVFKNFIKIFLIVIFGFFIYLIVDLIIYLTKNKGFHDKYGRKFYQKNILDSKTMFQYDSKQRNNNFKNSIKNGYKNMSNSRLVIITLARDIEKRFNKSKTKLETIGKLFKDYQIIVFENDSKDNSRNLLTKWSIKNPNVKLLTCCEQGNCDCKFNNKTGYDYGVFSKKRIDKMTYYRNFMLNFIKNTKYHLYDYLLVYDFDIKGGIYLDGIATSFSNPDKWDMICANGLMATPHITGYNTATYDSISYIGKNDNMNYRSHAFLEWVKMNRQVNSNIGGKLIKVKSCFNGFAFYKMKSIINSNYNSKYKCEHIGLHKEMIDNGYSKLFFNPSMIVFVGQQGPKNKLKLLIDELKKK